MDSTQFRASIREAFLKADEGRFRTCCPQAPQAPWLPWLLPTVPAFRSQASGSQVSLEYKTRFMLPWWYYNSTWHEDVEPISLKMISANNARGQLSSKTLRHDRSLKFVSQLNLRPDDQLVVLRTVLEQGSKNGYNSYKCFHLLLGAPQRYSFEALTLVRLISYES